MKKIFFENNIRKGGIAEEIAILKQRREARKLKEEKKNISVPATIRCEKESEAEFQKMIIKKKNEIFSKNKIMPYDSSLNSKIFVVVRKRPLMQKEKESGEVDCVSVINPRVYIHECKIQIDGFTKYLEDHEFYFDNTFDENNKTSDIYACTISPLISSILNQGIVTCFAYGQTGSGKTYTMKGIESQAIDDLYSLNKALGNKFEFYISFFEIYEGRLYDLLNNRLQLQVLDDKNGKMQIYGLINQLSDNKEMMHHIIDSANAIRTTHNTVTNETSSRSHAICNIVVKLRGDDKEWGKLSLVDLAGSERAQETKCNNKQRRAEGAEINKSLLALKECIRALEEKKNVNPDTHVPFRASKLTHVLRDSFVSKNDKSKIIMISCVSPSYKSANHSINTLRYSDRLKEKTKKHFGGNYNNLNFNNRNMNSKDNFIKEKKENFSPNPAFSEFNFYKQSNSIVEFTKEKPLKTDSGKEKAKIINSIGKSKPNESNKEKDITIDINKIPKKQNEFRKLKTNTKPIGIKKPFLSNSKNKFKNIDSDITRTKEQLTTNNISNISIHQKLSNSNIKCLDININKSTIQVPHCFSAGKNIKDNYIKYHQIVDSVIKIEDDIICSHTEAVKQDAMILSQESCLLTYIKGISNSNMTIGEYINKLESIISQKSKLYDNIQLKIDQYKKSIKDEAELKKKLRI